MSKDIKLNFDTITEFENKIANFFGSKYAIAVDCCTHGLELCLRYTKASWINVPTHTYISVPFLANKLGIELQFSDINWKKYYYITENIIDAAVLWEKESYIQNTFMCLSFQYRKHLNLGRGGMILTDNKEAALELKKMSYDGRLPDVPWREQNISSVGYHYYMTPETAQLGLDKLQNAVESEPELWSISDWPDISKMDVFNKSDLKNIEFNLKFFTNFKHINGNIYESPDNGKTIYVREIGMPHETRVQIK